MHCFKYNIGNSMKCYGNQRREYICPASKEAKNLKSFTEEGALQQALKDPQEEEKGHPRRNKSTGGTRDGKPGSELAHTVVCPDTQKYAWTGGAEASSDTGRTW